MRTLIFSIFFASLLIFYFSNAYPEDYYTDDFSNGKSKLRWSFFPFFNLDNLNAVVDPEAPDGDNGIGILKNSNAGGFASLSYAVTKQMENFYIEALVYCPVTEGNKGPLSGIAFLIDPINGNFYRLVCDLKTDDPTINLAYVGVDTRNYPVYLKIWHANEAIGVTPKKSTWYKMAIKVKNSKATVYLNNITLSGGPFIVDRVKRGFAGVYANFVGGLGEVTTKVDRFFIKIEGR
ncbi:MAG: hypothetical protein N3A59_08470 [Thermodesulfovibrionales bacterium]|nr:hypothetical protein [Thermodesulfovibrionales bacterium]